MTGDDGRLARTDAGSGIFEADDVRTYTLDDIVERNGPRTPAMAEAQWDFRAALILLTDEDHPATSDQLDMLSEHAAWFAQRGSDDRAWLHNFHEATRGRGSITLDGLATALKAVASPSTGLPASYGRVPAAHASLIDGTCATFDPSRDATSTVLRRADAHGGFVPRPLQRQPSRQDVEATPDVPPPGASGELRSQSRVAARRH